jgi:hypothetical protein
MHNDDDAPSPTPSPTPPLLPPHNESYPSLSSITGANDDDARACPKLLRWAERVPMLNAKVYSMGRCNFHMVVDRDSLELRVVLFALAVDAVVSTALLLLLPEGENNAGKNGGEGVLVALPIRQKMIDTAALRGQWINAPRHGNQS